MTKYNPLPLLFFLLALSFFVNIAYANETDYSVYDLMALPEHVAEHLMISVFAAGLICSGVLFLICLLPMTIITRSKRSSWIPELALTLIIMGFCIAITWLPIFFIIAFALIIALMFSSKMRAFITGR